jgi:hypothetical protein
MLLHPFAPTKGKSQRDMQPRSKVTVECEGKKYSATYYTTGRMVIVDSVYGRESKQRGGSQPDEVARILLYQLLRAAKSRGTLQAKRKKN